MVSAPKDLDHHLDHRVRIDDLYDVYICYLLIVAQQASTNRSTWAFPRCSLFAGLSSYRVPEDRERITGNTYVQKKPRVYRCQHHN